MHLFLAQWIVQSWINVCSVTYSKVYLISAFLKYQKGLYNNIYYGILDLYLILTQLYTDAMIDASNSSSLVLGVYLFLTAPWQ